MPAALIASITAVYPRWRGNTQWQSGAMFDPAVYPAGAGNTERHPDALTRCAVYPRWRGEHYRYTPHNELTNGLSPLAREHYSV